jgi:transmembrane sensor
MSRLDPPIKNHLRDPFDEADLHRIWTQIDGRLPVARKRRRVFAGGFVLAACAAAVLFLANARRDAGPLRFADGHALAVVEAPAEGATLSLSDGSSIRLGPGASFQPVESTGTRLLAVLQRGSAEFEVRPGGPRHWQIECGLATVEVTGTRFGCSRAPGSLRVSVQHGSVVVRGERVPDRARRLSAGESLDVTEAPAAAVLDAPEAPPAVEQAAPAAAPQRAPVSASWRELAHAGRHDQAFAALGAPGVRRETQRLGVADLLALADVARLSGHPKEAVAPLERILRDFSSDPQAPLAAFALGRLELDSLSRPARAAVALHRALSLGVPRSLEEDVRARLVEASERAGDNEAAVAAAREYLLRLPAGRHRAEMEARLTR